MMNHMKWLVAFGTLMLAAGCGPLESEDSLDTPLPSAEQTEASPGTQDIHAAATCAEQCQAARARCASNCNGNSTCLHRCQINVELCIRGCP
jgi:hypothetical protein